MRAVLAMWILAALAAWTVCGYLVMTKPDHGGGVSFILGLAGVAAAATATSLVSPPDPGDDPPPDRVVDN